MTNRIYLALLLAAAVALAPAVSLAADATIGFYTDAVGSSCSFSGNQPGLLTAYVVVRPGTSGVQSVRFSAPMPSCFDATFLSETIPSPLAGMGSSLTGITILSPNCETSPFTALQVFYMSHGGTASCCEFSIVADPSTGLLEAFDCSNASTPISSVTSHFNADASCDCNSVLPPDAPSIPQPPDESTMRDINEPLIWYSSDPSGRPMTADVYFGLDASPPLVASDVVVEPYTTYWPENFLLYGTTYYWKVVLRNSGGAETSGPVWSFSTKPNHPPTLSDPIPENGAIQLRIFDPFVLSWAADDPDGHALLFDVYFGSNPSPPKVSSQAARSFAVHDLQFSTTYYWHVVARDAFGMETTGPTWSFTMKAENDAPTVPSNPVPTNGAVNIQLSTTLNWTSTDLEGEAVHFDVYFGIGEPLARVATNISPRNHSVSGLSLLTTYYWRVVARDTNGQESTGPTWSFRTRSNVPPNEPANPSPKNQGSNYGLNPPLNWTCTDPDGQPLTFDVHFGTADPPPLVASNLPTTTYNTGLTLEYETTYYWQVVARDPFGAMRNGDVWRFSTKPVNLPPNHITNHSPHPGATNVDQNADFSWECTDPEGQPLEFSVSLSAYPEGERRYVSGLTTTSWDPGMLVPDQLYNWRVIARDNAGGERVGNVLYFRTSANGDYPPTVPSDPRPLDSQSTSVNPRLTWTSVDLGGQPLTFNIAFGTTNPPPLVATTTNREYFPGTLIVDATYYWQVTVNDGTWPAAIGPVWRFFVSDHAVPVLFSRFDAELTGDGVNVSWEFSSDEPLDNYTLYRREGGATLANVITSGAVNGTSGSYMDSAVDGAKTYRYELLVRTRDGDEFRSTPASVTLPVRELALHQNVPNPFNPQTTIRYDLVSEGRVTLAIFDSSGRRIRTLVDEDQTPGSREVVWTGRDDAGNPVSSGVYFYVLDAGKERLTRKLVLLK